MYVDRVPIGVVAIVTNWTTSLIQLLHQLVPALLSGNTVVIKASGLAPLTGHFLAHVLNLTGIIKPLMTSLLTVSFISIRFKPGFLVIVQVVPIPPIVSKISETIVAIGKIGAIIWKVVQ